MLAYEQMIKRDTFLGRFRYLVLDGNVGAETFGFDRHLNQAFYNSPEWKSVRNQVVVRDGGCDLGIPDRPIHGRILVHHMNPMTPRDLIHFDDSVLDPDYLVCISHGTHNAIHFGDESQLHMEWVERRPGDTKLW